MKKIIKILTSLLLSFCYLSFNLYAATRGAQELIPAGHWVYDSLMQISLESGIVNFADSAPLSIQELKLYLSEINYDSLSESGKSNLDKIYKYIDAPDFSFGYNIFKLGTRPAVNTSAFFKTNDDIDWVFDRYQREPLLEVPMTLTCGDYATFNMDLYIGENRGMSLHNDNYTNIFFNPADGDINFPDDAYFSTGYMFNDRVGMGFQIGSYSRSVGKTLTGSMIWSEYMKGATNAQLEFYSPYLKWTSTISELNVDKYVYAHELDLRLFKKFQFTAYEGFCVYAPLELRYLNPITIFHGFAAWRDYEPGDVESNCGDFLGVKLQYTPIPNLRIYGIYAMTQFQTAFERKHWPEDATPNGMGFQLGAEYSIPVNDGLLHFELEGTYADPYLYIKESPNWSFVRTYEENVGDHAVFYDWIGSPLGPDTISAKLKTTYEISPKYKVDLSYLFMARGELSGTSVFDKIKWGGTYTDFPYKDGYDYRQETDEDGNPDEHVKNWEYPDKDNQGKEEALAKRDRKAPSGIPEYVNNITLRGSWFVNDWLTLKAQTSYVIVLNSGHKNNKTEQGFEMAVGAKIQFANLKKNKQVKNEITE